MEYEPDYGYEDHSTKFAPGPDRCENLELYQKGGYHPVMIGDRLLNGTYTIVHKLGAGGAATVWLAKAELDGCSQYVALKILTADNSEDCNELSIHKYLAKQAKEGGKVNSIAALLDSFWIKGPNGNHLCLAFEVCGPSVSSLRYYSGTRKIRPDVVRSLGRLMAQGLEELHQAGVTYGDLSAANVLFRLVDINSWTTDMVYDKFGHPEPDEVQTYDGRPVPECVPKYVYEPIQFQNLDIELLKCEVVFVDLADGHIMSTSTTDEFTGYTLGYTAPETLWFGKKQTPGSDIWALGCLLYEMRSASQMFEEGAGGPGGLKCDIINLIGPLPASWAEKLPQEDRFDDIPEEEIQAEGDGDRLSGEEYCTHETSAAPLAQAESFDIIKSIEKAWTWLKARFRKAEEPLIADVEDGNNSVDLADEEANLANGRPVIPEYFRPKEYVPQDESLPSKVKRIGEWREWHYLSVEERERRFKEYYEDFCGIDEDVTLTKIDHEPPPAPLSEQERIDFEDLLSKIFRYEESERLSTAGMLAHPWLNKSYGEIGADPWLKPYSIGREFCIY